MDAHSTGIKKRSTIYAHRGSSIVMPENTLLAYEWALAQGADVLETDVRLSRDGTLHMFHDEGLSRITETSGLVLDVSDDDLNALDYKQGQTAESYCYQ